MEKALVLARELAGLGHSRAVILAAPVALRAAPTHWSSSMTSGVLRPAGWRVLWIVCLAFGAAQISLAAGPVDAYLAQRQAFVQQLQDDPAAALRDADNRARLARSLPAADARRADALELLVLARVHASEFDKALPLIKEVVRIRRAARPPEPQLLAWSLGLQATVLLACGRGDDADAAFTQSMLAWQQAFAPQDLRLAPWLEAQAAGLQRNGSGRPQWAIELLREAARLRAQHPELSCGRLAQTLEELAIHEMNLTQYAQADEHLVAAARLLDIESQNDPQREELKAAVANNLMMRAGIAAALGDKPRVLELAAQAGAITLGDRTLQAQTQSLIAASLASVLGSMGDTEGAIAAHRRTVEVFQHAQDLMDSGALDKELLGASFVALARLHLERQEPGLARQTLRAARQTLGETAEVLFTAAELERQSGDEQRSIAFYGAALTLREAQAVELPVLYAEQGASLPGEADDPLLSGHSMVLVPHASKPRTAPFIPAFTVPLPAALAAADPPLILRLQQDIDAARWAADAVTLTARARRYPKSALVWVHGFNVTRDEALKQAAQVAHGLEFDGAVFVYRWPSRTPAHLANNPQAAAGLGRFLDQVALTPGIEKVHLIAHGAGNQLLLSALVRSASDTQGRLRAKLREVVLLTPAVPLDSFKDELDAFAKSAPASMRLTLYAAPVDRSLWDAWQAGGPTSLAGEASMGVPLLHRSVQTLELAKASTLGVSQLNGDRLVMNPVISQDLRALLQPGASRPPERRNPLFRLVRPADGSTAWWAYEPKPASRK
jgi:hypothetical protein